MSNCICWREGSQVATLHQALTDEGSRADAMELIRSLIEAIVLVPEDGKLRTEVRRELATSWPLLQGERSRPQQTGILHTRLRWLRGQDLNLRPSGYESDLKRT
jgi:hypothetical protein